ncbi:MAG: hypothetical protein F6K41_07000 [Symploca sp. SIO3E6]|nr:hypothetical protein [Caldora sp. SIO3E6]
MAFFSSKTLHFYQKMPPELLTYYLLLITDYFKTCVNRLIQQTLLSFSDCVEAEESTTSTTMPTNKATTAIVKNSNFNPRS